MATRDTLFQQFGPKLMEAIVKDLFENVKELRRTTGLPERTYEDFLDEIAGRMPTINDYDWMGSNT